MFSPQSRLRHAVADTFAMVVYCSVVNMLIEIFLSGMSFEQSLSSRLVAIPVNILIAWPYGVYRDLIMRVARKASPAGWDQKPGGCIGLCHLPVTRLYYHLADRRRRLASDSGRREFKHCRFNVNGRGLWLLPGLLSSPV